MDYALGIFIAGFMMLVLSVFLFLKRGDSGAKDLIAIANSKNGQIATLDNKTAEAFRLLEELGISVKGLKNRCDSTEAALQEKTMQVKELWQHSEAMTRSTNLEIELMKKASKRENLAIDLFFYEGNKKTLGQKPRAKQVTQ